MSVETVRVSTNGQLVIPKAARDELGVHEGTLFAIVASGDTLVLKKMETPDEGTLWKELDRVAKEGGKRLTAKGLSEKDIPDLVERARKRRTV